MIQFADDQTKGQVRDMWETCFGDPVNYMEVYFRRKYRNEDTLLYVEEGRALSSLQMLSYKFTFWGIEIPVIYLSGVCTLPGHRGKGYSRQLLLKSFEVAAERGVPLILLVPQEKWLLDFYSKFGFAQTFDPCKEELPSIKKILDSHSGNLHAAYDEFNARFRHVDMTIQKSFGDFQAIVEEAALFDYPAKTYLIGMSRVVDAERLLSIFGEMASSTPLTLAVEDDLISSNNGVFAIHEGGNAKRVLEAGRGQQCPLSVDIRELAQLLMGYHTSERGDILGSIFPARSPKMHFMLE